MKHRYSAIIALATLACSLLAAPANAQSRRAIWVWNTQQIRNNPSARADFFKFLAAPFGDKDHAIKIVYFDGLNVPDFSNPFIVASARSFLKDAHARGLRVEFLTGDPSWATVAGEPGAIACINAVLGFNKAGSPAERYDGFQYDVEPYSLPGWPSAALEQGQLDLLDKSNAAIKASGQRLPITSCIPRWYGQAQFNFLDRAIIDRSDAIVVMDYVTTVGQLVNDPQDVLVYATKKGKPVWLGVETTPLPDTPRTTFFGSTNTQMESILSQALPILKLQPSFHGYAVHQYAYYPSLKP